MHRIALVLLTAILLSATAALGRGTPTVADRQVARYDPSNVLTVHGTGLSKAGTDTFALFGGPGTHEGKFSNADGSPMSQAQLLADGWIFNDVTDLPTLWQRSTFNMANLNGHGVGNHGMWAGQDASQRPGWATAPGYGNSWNAQLNFTAPMVDPSFGQTVGLEFVFNHDSEYAYDFFVVDYKKASSSFTVYSIDGTNHDGSNVFAAPGVQYSLQATAPITYAGNDYPNDMITLRMRATSDGAWSDEDGLWPTVAGLAQVDDITVTYHDGVSPQSVSEDFEGPGPYAWQPVKAPFAGFFGKVFTQFQDLDPCRSNLSPVFAFFDDGTGPFNPGYTGTGTGGSTSPNWSYGVPGGWVVNSNGGISNGLLEMQNYLESPEIAWDLPGTADDGPDVVGARFRFDVWRHFVLSDGFFYSWDVRARDSVSGNWSSWDNRNFGYWGGPDWLRADHDVTDLLETQNGPDVVQFRVGILDLAQVIAFPGTDSTPSPVFDNIAMKKYRIGGPTITTRNIDLFHDAFPQSGQIDAATLVARDALDVRIDMARDVSTGTQNIPGDSLIVDITAVIPGTSVNPASVRLSFALHKNPYFEDAIRGNLTGYPGASVSAGSGFSGWDVVHGTTAGQVSTTPGGTPVPGRWFFDLPDQDFLYPGDFLQYYIEAADTDGRRSVLPEDVSGFGMPLYSRVFTVRALPTLTAAGAPDVLLVNDFGHRGAEDEYRLALLYNGLAESGPSTLDIYTVRGPTSNVSNGIGSTGAHGASALQLSTYSCVIYSAGDLSNSLSDGSDTGLSDKGDDVGVLTAWKTQARDRYTVHFGDNVVSGLANLGPSGSAYLSDVMGVEFVDQDVRDEIGGLLTPNVTALAPGMSEDFFVYGGCLSINRFDSINPLPGAIASHEFVPGAGGSARTAGVLYDRVESGFRKVDFTFPYDLDNVWNAGAPNPGGLSDRALLLEEILSIFGTHGGGAILVGADHPASPRLEFESSYPNPFNPRTTLRFSLGVEGPVSVHVFDLRGRLVQTLLDHEVRGAGAHELVWDGTDRVGAGVASGVYVARVEANGFSESRKLALVR